MPDIQSDTAEQAAPAGPPPITHPMDPRRGDNLSPMFAAFLAWLLQLPAVTQPAITGISISSGCVFAATTDNPYHNSLIGDWPDLRGNLRRWGAVCGADPQMIDASSTGRGEQEHEPLR